MFYMETLLCQFQKVDALFQCFATVGYGVFTFNFVKWISLLLKKKLFNMDTYISFKTVFDTSFQYFI